jgi:hypothetical protein
MTRRVVINVSALPDPREVSYDLFVCSYFILAEGRGS